MARVGQTLQTGSLHIFTQRESANLDSDSLCFRRVPNVPV